MNIEYLFFVLLKYILSTDFNGIRFKKHIYEWDTLALEWQKVSATKGGSQNWLDYFIKQVYIA